MAIINPKPSDFINAQKRALDYQQYRSTSDVLRAVAQFYKVSVFKSTDDKPLYYITSGLETSVNVTDNKIQITVNKGSAVIDNQPIVFLDDFIFEFDKPSVDTTYYVYLRYKYVEEYPSNYAYIEIYTNPVNSEGYYTLAKISYKADSNTFTIDDSIYKEMRAKDIALKEECETSHEILTARANEIESVLIDLNETVNSEEIVNIIKKYDGEGSGLDADLLDGKQAADFADKYLSNVADSNILEKIKNVDGVGSGLDADTVDGLQMSQIKGIGFKNRVINGDFSVWQRGESFTFGQNKGGYTVDRFMMFSSSDGLFTVSKSFINNKNAVRITCENAPTNLNESYLTGFAYTFEGQHLYDLVIDKKNITISFWFNSNVAGEYSISMRNVTYSANTGIWDITKLDSYVTTFNYNTPNTPQKIVVTIPLNNTWSYEPVNNEKRGLELKIGFLNYGNTTTVTNTWINGENKSTTPTAVNWAAEAGNFIEIAELQVEEGDTATTFEYVPYDIQLQRCMRYYEVIHNAVAIKAPGNDDTFGYITFKVKKRDTPSVKFIRPSDGEVGADYYWNGGDDKLDTVQILSLNQDGLMFGRNNYTPDNTDNAYLVTHIITIAEL